MISFRKRLALSIVLTGQSFLLFTPAFVAQSAVAVEADGVGNAESWINQMTKQLCSSWPTAVSMMKTHLELVQRGLELLKRDEQLVREREAGRKQALPSDYMPLAHRKDQIGTSLDTIAQILPEMQKHLDAKTDKQLVDGDLIGAKGGFRIVIPGTSRADGNVLMQEAQTVLKEHSDLLKLRRGADSQR